MRFVLFIVVWAFVGCRSPTEGGTLPCDPLGMAEAPIALGAILAVGRDAKGTLYVVDRLEIEYRMFVSESGTLRRQRIAGFGVMSGVGEERHSFNVTDHHPPFRLQVDVSNEKTRMGVVLDPPPNMRTITIGQDGEELTVVPATDITSMPVRNFAPVVVVEYVAELGDGRLLLVIRPRDDWSYEDFRVFFGASLRVVERKVDNVRRMRDGGSTFITFALDGSSATASFPVVSTGTGFEPGPATIVIGGETLALTRLPNEQPPAAEYSCLAP